MAKFVEHFTVACNARLGVTVHIRGAPSHPSFAPALPHDPQMAENSTAEMLQPLGARLARLWHAMFLDDTAKALLCARCTRVEAHLPSKLLSRVPLLPSAISHQASTESLTVVLHWLGEIGEVPHVSRQGYAGG